MALGERVRGLFRLSNKTIFQKLALIAVPFLVPVGVLTYFLIETNTAQIDFTRSEKAGLDYINRVRRMVQFVEQHQVLASSAADAAARPRLAAKEDEIGQEVAAIDELDRKYGATLKTSERWGSARGRWQAIKEKGAALKPAESNEAHERLVADLLVLVADAGEFSNLALDPENAAYYVQDSMIARELALSDYLTQAQVQGAALLAQGAAAPAEGRTALATRLALAQGLRDALADNYARAFRANPALKPKLDAALQERLSALEQFVTFAEAKLVKGDGAGVTASAWQEAASRAIDKGYRLYDASEPELEQMLDARVAKLRATTTYAILAIIGGLLVVALAAYVVARSVLRQVGGITAMFNEIGMGNFAARAEVSSEDELGELATSLNAMLDNTLALLQSREEKEQIQASIAKLLEEVAGVAEGDLTRDAEVTADVTGAIADSFNYLIEQLRKIISNVQDATMLVSGSASQIRDTAEHLADGSETQAEQIVQTTAALGEISSSIQQVSESAGVSAGVAQQALVNAKKGNESVQNTIDGMNRIRDQVQETAKRIKRLGESSQEIGQITQLIDDIADRTSILALNASIQAAMAGEAGRGFAVVAEEVERLAIRSTEATKKIATLVKTIQGETNEAVAAMERSINEVVEGSSLANEAGRALGEIEAVSNRLAELIGSISQASKQQARGSEAVVKSMNEISEVTQTTAAGTKQAAESVTQLAELADSLRESLNTFRLPERKGHGTREVVRPSVRREALEAAGAGAR